MFALQLSIPRLLYLTFSPSSILLSSTTLSFFLNIFNNHHIIIFNYLITRHTIEFIITDHLMNVSRLSGLWSRRRCAHGIDVGGIGHP